LNIIEALTLARDHGKKVRPKCWLSTPSKVVFYRGHQFRAMLRGDMKREIEFALSWEHELLGEWEEVPDAT
jgi:hypothetical protein